MQSLALDPAALKWRRQRRRWWVAAAAVTAGSRWQAAICPCNLVAFRCFHCQTQSGLNCRARSTCCGEAWAVRGRCDVGHRGRGSHQCVFANWTHTSGVRQSGEATHYIIPLEDPWSASGSGSRACPLRPASASSVSRRAQAARIAASRGVTLHLAYLQSVLRIPTRGERRTAASTLSLRR